MATNHVSPDSESDAFLGLSPEVQHLDAETKKRYLEKLNYLGTRDPYIMPSSMFTDIKKFETLNLKASDLPDINEQEIFHYLVDR